MKQTSPPSPLALIFSCLSSPLFSILSFPGECTVHSPRYVLPRDHGWFRRIRSAPVSVNVDVDINVDVHVNIEINIIVDVRKSINECWSGWTFLTECARLGGGSRVGRGRGDVPERLWWVSSDEKRAPRRR